MALSHKSNKLFPIYRFSVLGLKTMWPINHTHTPYIIRVSHVAWTNVIAQIYGLIFAWPVKPWILFGANSFSEDGMADWLWPGKWVMNGCGCAYFHNTVHVRKCVMFTLWWRPSVLISVPGLCTFPGTDRPSMDKWCSQFVLGELSVSRKDGRILLEVKDGV